ncbi:MULTISPECIES: hypothetical protein [Mesorhizobium]|uniref:hypothetical protein n=1 Tax=Mesorhizobium TaxID=68287 RepID=UPI000AEEC41B|nr:MULTISPECIES: hypothetical protein [Mesorhizobium]
MTAWRRVSPLAAAIPVRALAGDQYAVIAANKGMDFLPYRLRPIYISIEIDAGEDGT